MLMGCGRSPPPLLYGLEVTRDKAGPGGDTDEDLPRDDPEGDELMTREGWLLLIC